MKYSTSKCIQTLPSGVKSCTIMQSLDLPSHANRDVQGDSGAFPAGNRWGRNWPPFFVPTPQHFIELLRASIKIQIDAKSSKFPQQRGEKIMNKLNLLAVTTIVALAFTTNANAKTNRYEQTQVANGGSIAGRILFKGQAPAPIMEDLSKGKNAEFCATHPDTQAGGIRPRQKVVVRDGKLVNTVILIENISKGKAWEQKPTTFDFRQCDIFPKITVIRKTPKGMKTGLAQVTNQDANTLHNPHGYSVKGASRKTLFNKPLPSKGSVADVTRSLKRLKQKKDSHFFLQCDQHNYMEADARIVWNPYYTISAEDGSFTLDNIPAGTYKVTAWHPYVGQVTQEISVNEGGTTQTQFELAAK